MIKDIIDEFHAYRIAGEHKKAIESIRLLRSRFSFSKAEIVTALVKSDFLEDECLDYLKTHINAAEQ